MKNFYLTLLFILLLATSAFARIRPITEWNNKLDDRVSIMNVQIYCKEKCPGYSITTTTCNNKEEILEGCPEPRCNYYYRCVQQQ